MQHHLVLMSPVEYRKVPQIPAAACRTSTSFVCDLTDKPYALACPALNNNMSHAGYGSPASRDTRHWEIRGLTLGTDNWTR